VFGSLARTVMAGRLQAVSITVLFAVLALFLPPFSLLSSGAVGLVSLRNGWQAGLSIIGIGTIILSLMSLLIGDPTVGLVYGLSSWLPVLLVAHVLRQTSSWQLTFQVIVGLMVVIMLMVHVLVPDLNSLWQTLLNEMFAPVIEQASPDEASQFRELIERVSGLMTGVLAASVMSSTVLALFIARSWQAQLFNPGGFGEEFRELRLGIPSAGIAVAAFVAALLIQAPWIQELAVIVILPFFFQGIAVIHGINRLLNWHVAVLVVMYFLMILALPQMMALLSATGLIDSFIDFRKRLVSKADSSS
jgi:hypothetical protein